MAGFESRIIVGRYAADGQPLAVAVDDQGRLLIGSSASGSGTITVGDEWDLLLRSDVAANDSDKSFATPQGFQDQVLWVYVELTSSGTAGNRNMTLAIVSALGAQIFEVRAGVTQAASLTYNYSFGPSLADLTAVRDTTFVMTPIPPTLFLMAGQNIRVWDQNAVDAGADDMNVYIQIARRAV